jgi:hypothetical protein
LSGTTDNGVITLNGSSPNGTVESNLTFDGTTLKVTGDILINNKVSIQAKSQSVTGTSTIFTLTSYSGMVMDYLAKNGSNMRAGTLVGIWDGTSSNLSETTTTDLGNTTAVSFTVSSTGTINAVVSSGTWTITATARALGV